MESFKEQLERELEQKEAEIEGLRQRGECTISALQDARKIAEKLYDITGNPEFEQRADYYFWASDREAGRALNEASMAIKAERAQKPWWRRIFIRRP